MNDAMLPFMITLQHRDAKSTIESLEYKFYSDESGVTMLHHAAASGNEDVTRYLLQEGCDVNIQDVRGTTPLMMAVLGNHEEIVSILLSAGADMNIFNNKKESALHMVFNRHEVSVSIVTLFLTAVQQQFSFSEDIAKSLIDAGCHVYQAAYLKDANVIDYMLSNGSPIDSSHPVDNHTALHLSVALGDLETVKLLLKCGANAKALDAMGATPLHHLYLHDSGHTREKLEVLKILLSHDVPLTSSTLDGTFQISPTLVRGNSEAIRAVLKSNIDLTAKDEFNKMDVLHYLVLNRNPGVVEELKLRVDDYDVNAIDECGMNSLFGAVYTGNADMMKFLLEQGADVNLINNPDGYTTIFYAYVESTVGHESRYDQCVQLLLQYDADPQFVVNINDEQITVFDLASKTNSYDRMKAIVAHLAMLERRGTPITEIIISKINSQPSLKKYLQKCRRVLNREIAPLVTVFGLLTDSKEKMARYTDDELVNKLYRICIKNEVKLTYPYYYHIAEKRYWEARRYQRATGAICSIFEDRIDENHLIIREIASYLDNQTLCTLSQCSKLYKKHPY